MSREPLPLTNVEEAALLRALGDQTRGKSLFGFELTVPVLATVQRLAVRYYVMIASDHETAGRLVRSFWQRTWGIEFTGPNRSRDISPEAALHRGALVLLERPEGWVDDGTSADAENRFSRVEDRCLLAALLATMAREER